MLLRDLESVTRYELLDIARNWLYRFTALLVCGTAAGVDIYVYFRPVQASTSISMEDVLLQGIDRISTRSFRNWDYFTAAASLPYISTLASTIILCIAASFIAAALIRKDSMLDTFESLHVRPASNPSFVTGKFLAVIISFGLIAVLGLAVSLIVNTFIDDLPIQWEAYALYPLVVTLPALAFVTGLSFCLAMISGSSAFAFFITASVVIASVVLPLTSANHLFDLAGIRLPLLYSDFTGFSNAPILLLQRGVYAFLGIGLLGAAALMYRRLHHARLLRWMTILICIASVTFAAIFGKELDANVTKGMHLRERIAMVNARYAECPVVTVTSCRLDVTHEGSSIRATVAIAVENATANPMESYIFSLNPGLDVEAVTCGETDISFHRDLHIIDITPLEPLAPGAADTIEVVYHGSIEEDACYPDISEDERALPHGFVFCNIAKRYAFIGYEYVLLTPETLWYPVAGAPFGSIFPEPQKRDFIDFELSVHTDGHLKALSQGACVQTDSLTMRFVPEYPLPHLSLVIGDYEQHTAVVDSIEYTVHLLRGHDFFSHLFQELQGEKLQEWVHSMKTSFDASYGSYPYARLALVEVPIQFYTYPRAWSGEMQSVQPEMVFLPEKGYSCFRSQGDFATTINNSDALYGGRISRVDIEQSAASSFLYYALRRIDYDTAPATAGIIPFFLNRKRAPASSFGIVPMYSLFQLHMNSQEYAFFSSIIEKYFEFKSWSTPSSVNLAASHYLSDSSLHTILHDPECKDIRRIMLKAKCDEFFSILEAKTGDEKLRETINDFIASHRFSCCNLESFMHAIRETYNIDLGEEMRDWYTRAGVPGYVITDSQSRRIEYEGRIVHQVQFTIHNLEPVRGLVRISGYEIDSNYGLRDQISRTVMLDGNQSKEIGLVLSDSQNIQLQIQFSLSMNHPTSVSLVYNNRIESEPGEPFDGERILLEQFAPAGPGEIIVDNADPGFEIIPLRQRWMFLQNLIPKDEPPVPAPRRFMGYDASFHPDWTYTVYPSFYGVYAKTAYQISAGEGFHRVRWTADLPAAGEYDIFYCSFIFDLTKTLPAQYINEHLPQFKGITSVDDYHFTVRHANGANEVTKSMGDYFERTNPVEVYLGTFMFDKGPAVVELTDQSKGMYVFADAVKWVKR